MKRLFLFCVVVFGVTLIGSLGFSATAWYFPEGSTQGFDLWILVTNPTSTDASITYTFYTDDSTVTSTATVTANERSTLWVNSIDGLDDKPISTQVECTNGLNIYAERAQYWPKKYGTSVTEWSGGHTSRGVSLEEGCNNEIKQPSSFPITISTAGVYKLTANLSCTDEDTHAIQITASNVTLDLNGFTITGPGGTSGDSGHGIYVDGDAGGYLHNIVVKNGNIYQFRKNGLHAEYVYNLTIDGLQLFENGRYGIEHDFTRATLTQNCNFSYNGLETTETGAGGFNSSMAGIISNNSFYYNYGYGMYIDSSGNLIKENTVVGSRNHDGFLNDSGVFFAMDSNVFQNNVVFNSQSGTDIDLNSKDILCVENAIGGTIDNAGSANVTIISQANTDINS